MQAVALQIGNRGRLAAREHLRQGLAQPRHDETYPFHGAGGYGYRNLLWARGY